MSECAHILLPDGRKIYGGSFFDAPAGKRFLTINLMEERPLLQSEIYLPVKDYNVPSNPQDLVDAFDKILADHRNAYVGCFGGVGRTGLFMSCFLKYIGESEPLARVRREFNLHAVETPEQEKFLADFHFTAPQAISSVPRPR